MRFLRFLRQEDPTSSVAFHLEGLLEVQERIRLKLENLDPHFGDENFARALTELQIEIYSHLAFHLKELRGPFKNIVGRAYEGLPELDEESEIQRLQALMIE